MKQKYVLVQELEPHARLAELKTIVYQGMLVFYEVGKALIEIRDTALYKIEGYERFEDFCKTEFDISRPRAYQLIDAAETVDNLCLPAVDIPSERAIRPLSKLSPEDQQSVWQDVVDSGEKPTAKFVESKVAEYLPPKEPRKASPPPEEPLTEEPEVEEPVEKLTLSDGTVVSASDVKAMMQERDELLNGLDDNHSRNHYLKMGALRREISDRGSIVEECNTQIAQLRGQHRQEIERLERENNKLRGDYEALMVENERIRNLDDFEGLKAIAHFEEISGVPVEMLIQARKEVYPDEEHGICLRFFLEESREQF
jgi:hypothetical protein